MTEPNYYELLGVMRNAPPEVIRGAYKALAQKYHPDKNLGDAEAARMMTALNRAALTLLNAEKRQAYDEFLNGQAAASPERPERPETPEPDTVTPNPSTETMEETAPKPVNWYSGWRVLVTATVTVVSAKLIGILGTLIAFFVFYWVRPRRGTGQAAAAAGIVGLAVAGIYSAVLLPIYQQSESVDKKQGDMSWLERGSTVVDNASSSLTSAQQSSYPPSRSDYVEAVLAIQRRMASRQLAVIPARVDLSSINGVSTTAIRAHALEFTQTWWKNDSGVFIYLKNVTGLPVVGLEFVFSESLCTLPGTRKTFSTSFYRVLQPDEIAVIAIGRDPSFQTPNRSNCLTITAAKYAADVPAAASAPKPVAARPKEQERQDDPLRAQAIDNAAEALSRRNAGPYGR